MVQTIDADKVKLDAGPHSPAPSSARSREKHVLKTAVDVADLFAALDPTGRAILAKDLVAAGEELAARPPEIKALLKVTSLTWIDDDKGNVDLSVKASEGGDELVRVRVRDGAGNSTASTTEDSQASGMKT